MSDPTVNEVCIYSAMAFKRIAWEENRTATYAFLFILAILYIILPFEWIVWFLLGILSTIGLGTGVATGLLFLWPMVASVALEHHPFVDTWIRVLPACMFHALGSTVVELPPYLAAQSLVTQLNLETQPLYTWTVNYVTRWGAPMIFAFAIWPNSMFDMCGIASGVCNIPIYTFLVVTMAGKGLVRAPATAAVLIVANQSDILPEWMDAFVEAVLSKDGSTTGHVWTCAVTLLTLYMGWHTLRDIATNEKRYKQPR